MTRDYGSFPSARDDGEVDRDTESTPVFRRQRARSEQFHPSYEPFKNKQELQLQDHKVNGAVWFMKPTRATFTYHRDAEAVWDDQGSEEQAANRRQTNNAGHTPNSSSSSDFEYNWTSRNNRKGRHALVVHQSSDEYKEDHYSTGFSSVLTGVWRMLTRFAFWDISYLTAISFTLAVTILLVNAVLSVLPYVDPSFTPLPGATYIEGALTLTGCLFFFLSSFLSFVEAVNSKVDGCFGWKQERVYDTDEAGAEQGSTTRMVPDWDCIHQRNNSSKLFNSSSESGNDTSDYSNGTGMSHSKSKTQNHTLQWRFLPTRTELRKHLIYDIGFVTCAVLLCSSAVYCSAALASFITILTEGQISPWVRIPQIIAGIGFIASSILFMLETQSNWLVPEIKAIGWQISFFNLLGSIGFTLCAVFALANANAEDTWSEHQMAYSYLWGSSGFLFGSLLQWYESLDKHPVEYKERES